MSQPSQRTRAWQGKTKVRSQVNLKALYPDCSNHRVAFLELVETDPQCGFTDSVTLWEGPSESDCRVVWQTTFQKYWRDKTFEVPWVPLYQFIIWNSQIYYRRKVETSAILPDKAQELQKENAELVEKLNNQVLIIDKLVDNLTLLYKIANRHDIMNDAVRDSVESAVSLTTAGYNEDEIEVPQWCRDILAEIKNKSYD